MYISFHLKISASFKFSLTYLSLSSAEVPSSSLNQSGLRSTMQERLTRAFLKVGKIPSEDAEYEKSLTLHSQTGSPSSASFLILGGANGCLMNDPTFVTHGENDGLQLPVPIMKVSQRTTSYHQVFILKPIVVNNAVLMPTRTLKYRQSKTSGII